MKKREKTNQKTATKQTKKVWESPRIMDLDINQSTQNANSGPSVNDGGPSFSDYNS